MAIKDVFVLDDTAWLPGDWAKDPFLKTPFSPFLLRPILNVFQTLSLEKPLS